MTLTEHRGNRYGIALQSTWPHISLGVSAHIGGRFSHLSIHLPIGVLLIGCLGATEEEVPPVSITPELLGDMVAVTGWSEEAIKEFARWKIPWLLRK